MSLAIKNLQANVPDPTAPRRCLSLGLAARLDEALADLICDAIQRQLTFAPAGAVARARDAVFAFQDLYDARPVRDNFGGSGFNDSLWLFVLCRALAPSVIVESGVHKGHSTWLFRQACPTAAIYCFDITFENRVYHVVKAQYFEHDWMEAELPFKSLPKDHLIFFDDHIGHAQRLRQAHQRGFRLAVFDDNFPAYNLYATGGPPVPTLAMIFDPDLETDTEIAWTRNGKAYSFHYDAKEVQGVAALVERVEVLPELAGLTRHNLGSGLTVVQFAEPTPNKNNKGGNVT